MIKARLRLFGTVQGVFCRAFTKATAQEIGITGTVRNLPEGGVEVRCECRDEKELNRFLELLGSGSEDYPYQGVDIQKIEILEKTEVKERETTVFDVGY